ncbi:MAG TPA: cupin domain-containing protein [Bacteroidia bacterium]|nr:cupin domain-containing protein [Bacteroidia bacterium]
MKIRRTEYFVNSYFRHDDGIFPNNSSLPVLHYKSIVRVPAFFAARSFRKHFAANGWTNSWKGTIYDYHHYHSVTHEVLGCYSGSGEIRIGGEEGPVIIFEAGDVLVIPAGVAHKKVHDSKLRCIGAYPEGRSFDMQRGEAGERPAADNNIQSVPMPRKDPVFGCDGDLIFHWKGFRKMA